eukprot:ANDGO_02035.mRNA.1 Leucine-rich repeat protein soc-2 homolog
MDYELLEKSTIGYRSDDSYDLANIVSFSAQKQGLVEVPDLLSHATQMESLDLAHNEIARVSRHSLCALGNLKTLNLMCNAIETIDDDAFENQRLVHTLGLRSNRLTQVPMSLGRMDSLVTLFLTDNFITSLPKSIGNLKKLRKLQCSFNALTSLPDELAQCGELEFVRFSASKLTAEGIPSGLFSRMLKLKWLGLADNPVCPTPTSLDLVLLPRLPLASFSFSDTPTLGAGASGEVKQVEWNGMEIAAKRYPPGWKSPDGRMEDELYAQTAYPPHENLTEPVALLLEDAAVRGLLMKRVAGSSLAGRPNALSLLRCVYAPGTAFSVAAVVKIAKGCLAALSHLHEHGICHGDFYAHNLIVDDVKNPSSVVVCDFGGAFSFSSVTDLSLRSSIVVTDIRAFGLLFGELTARCDSLSAAHPLVCLQQRIVNASLSDSFTCSSLLTLLADIEQTL